MPAPQIPGDLLPADGRFGCGPSKVRPEQLAHLAAHAALLGTSHRQAPVKDLVGRVRAGVCRRCSGHPTATRSCWATAGRPRSGMPRPCRSSRRAASTSPLASSAPSSRRRHPPRSSRPRTSSTRPPDRAASSRRSPASTCTPGRTTRPRPGSWPPSRACTATTEPSPSSTRRAPRAASTSTPTETDVYYFAPQKNFAADGGLWFALVSPAAIERHRADRGERPLDPRVPQPAERRRQLAPRPDPQHPRALDPVAHGGAARLDQRQRRPRLGRRPHPRIVGRALRLGRGIRVRHPVRRRPRAPVAGRRHRRLRRHAWMPRPSRPRCARTASSTPSRTASSGRNQLRIATFTAIDPDDVRTLTGAIDWVVEHDDVRAPLT